ncbi:hypothetical protein L345_16004, partial [Ophiophagus hannah]
MEEKETACAKPAEQVQKESCVVQAGGPTEIPRRGSPLQIKQEPEEGLAQRWEAQWQNFLKMVQAPHPGWGSSPLPELVAFSDSKGIQPSGGTTPQGQDCFEEMTVNLPRIHQVCLGASRKLGGRLLNEQERPPFWAQDYLDRESTGRTSLPKNQDNVSPRSGLGKISENELMRPERSSGSLPTKRGSEAIPRTMEERDLRDPPPKKDPHGGEPLPRGTGREIKQEPDEGSLQQWEAQWREFLKTVETPCLGSSKPPVDPWENSLAFLDSFEQVARACRWPKEEWVPQLQPALSGEAEQAFLN